ncbi:MAG: hypothetical protein U0Q22_19730 [Acidimicrobiales bacterium]
MTTDAQQAANERNAKLSTGPTTEEGKRRTSQNAIKHSLHARTDRAVTAGPFAEDEADVEEFLAAIVERLDPMDALQRSMAARIAGVHLKMSRLEIYEAVVLRGGARLPGRRGRRPLDDDQIDALNEEVVARYAIEGVMDKTSKLWTSLYRQLRGAMDEYARLTKLRAHASTIDTLYDDEFYRGMSPAAKTEHAMGEAFGALRRLERFSAEAGHPQTFEIVPAEANQSTEPTVADR